MAEIRVNGRRFPALQSIDSVGALVKKLQNLGESQQSSVTSILVNGMECQFDMSQADNVRLAPDDVVDAKLETPEQLSFESLQVAQEMAELLVFDIKVATLALWEGTTAQYRSLETLLKDCQMFLQLAARPLDLLGQAPSDLPPQGIACLQELDNVANHTEDAVLLCVHGKHKDAAHVLVARLKTSLEKWLSLSAPFAQMLSLDNPDHFASALPHIIAVPSPTAP